MDGERRVRAGHLQLTSPVLLRALMDRWDFSLADVAVVAGTHRSAISHLLSGRAVGLRADRAGRVAAALRVEVQTLFVEPGTPVTRGVTWGKDRARPGEVERILAERDTPPTP